MRNLNEYIEKYNHEGFEDYQVIYRRKKVLETIQNYNPKCILEIGCGMEPLFKYLSSDTEKYVLVEPGGVFYENACKEAKKVSGLEIICHNKYLSDYAKHSNCDFDMIICASLLHELEDLDFFLDDILKICSEKTVVHFNVPNALSMHREIALCMGMINDKKELSDRNKDFQQKRVFDIAGLTDLLKKKFDIIDYGTFFVKPFTHQQMHKMIKNNIINEEILDGLYNLSKIKQYMDIGSEIYCNVKKRENN